MPLLYNADRDWYECTNCGGFITGRIAREMDDPEPVDLDEALQRAMGSVHRAPGETDGELRARLKGSDGPQHRDLSGGPQLKRYEWVRIVAFVTAALVLWVVVIYLLHT